MSRKRFFAIGVMSGTSLDGLDIAYCSYSQKKNKWSYKLYVGETISYDEVWKSRLSKAQSLTAEGLMKLHADYGQWIGHRCQEFIKRNKIKQLDLVSSHGHTVFHQPQNNFTFQLGDGNAIHAVVGAPVVFDFRSLDVQLGGQGAPLVPVGDRYLFSNYDICLNLGGIANLSMERKGKRTAYDICFVNMGLNFLMNTIGKNFDEKGSLASTGKVNDELLAKLISAYEPFTRARPSLAREQFENVFQPILNQQQILLEDRLRTFVECIALMISDAIARKKANKILVTGGGAKNKFLVNRLKNVLRPGDKIIIPDDHLIDFKEAVVFGLLGLLRKLNQKNVLRSVTRSTKNSISGLSIG